RGGGAWGEAWQGGMVGGGGLVEDLFGFSILLAAEAAELGHGPAIVWRSADDIAEADVIAWLRRARAQAGRASAFGSAASGVAAAGGPDRNAPLVLLIADGVLLPPALGAAMARLAEFA